MKKPNFFIIGSVKCGTTTLFSYLKKSSDVYFPVQKEPHYFSYVNTEKQFNGPGDNDFFEKYLKTLLDYESLFTNAKNEKAIGEASTMYLYYANVAEAIYGFNPDSKIIAIIRNPIERAYSHYLHHVRDKSAVAKNFNEALTEELNGKRDDWAPQRKFIDVGRYSEQLKRYYNVFPKEQILVLKFEDFIKAPNSMLNEVCNFLEIENIFKDTTISKHNASGVPKSQKLHSLYLNSVRFARRIFPFLTHSPLTDVRKRIDNLYRNNFLSKPEMDQKSRVLLQEIYSEEVKNLESLLGMNLSDWR